MRDRERQRAETRKKGIFFRDLSCFIQLFVWICDCFVVDFWFV